MLHLKGDKQSSNAALLQKTLARSKEARQHAEQQQAAWAKHAGFNQNVNAVTAEQAQFVAAQANYAEAIKQRQQVEKDNAGDYDKQGFAIYGEEKTNTQKQQQADAEDDNDLDDLHALRERRIAALKRGMDVTAELKARGHGEYQEIDQDGFLPTVTSTKHVICHFYHREFERCKIMDQHLSDIAKAHLESRFVKINAEKCPFFVTKLNIKVLPSVILFKDGIAVDRIVGFDELGETDEFSTQSLEKRLGTAQMIRVKEAPKVTDQPQTNAHARFMRGKALAALEDSDSDFD